MSTKLCLLQLVILKCTQCYSCMKLLMKSQKAYKCLFCGSWQSGENPLDFHFVTLGFVFGTHLPVGSN